MSALIGLLLAMLGQLIVLPTALQQQQQAAAMTTIITTAQQQQALLSSAQAYISQNQATYEATATASTAVTIPISTLAAANVGLPASFSSLNPFGQAWSVQVLQPTAGTLQTLVTSTGGTALSDLQVAAIAQNVGQPGGFIPQNDSGVYPLGATTVYGNQANFNISTAGYNGLSGGHPAALLVIANGQVQNNALYRVAVPGQPQLNTMSTALNMGGNAITNANGIVTSGGNNAQSVQVGNVWYYGDGANAAVRAVGGLYVQNLDGTQAADLSAGNISASGTLSSTGDTNTSGNNNVGGYITVNGAATAGAACPGPQYIGKGANGPLLCESGIWTAGGATWHSTWTYIGSGGGVNTNSWFPGAQMVQITAYAGAGNASNGGYSGGNVAFATVDGMAITQTYFDTSGAEDGLYIAGNMMIAGGSHTLAGTGGTSSTYGALNPAFYISGYLQ